MNDDSLYKKALEYHRQNPKGKIATQITKPMTSQLDLSLAYSPGVASPCVEIEKEVQKSFEYTGRANLVAVVTNGTAVLGLGDIGPHAAKPVMEGKAMLFKKYANIDVFDLEIDANDPDLFIQTVKALEPTFGGINLEDIKAPECFYIEKQLKESMAIPVFHDDQHGTAIIACAAFLNALELSNRRIEDTKVVMNGAGAAAIACAKLLQHLGVDPKNMILCDSVGVIYKGRKARMNPYKEKFASDTFKRTLAEALEGADAFVGVSVGDILTPQMLKSMKKAPLIFAMANPEPEVRPEVVEKVRPEAFIVTGRSDYQNQVNNVLCFPYMFRGALDTHSSTINEEMKMAAVRELAQIAKEPVPEVIQNFYPTEKNLEFSKNYIIPKINDPRPLVRLSLAVAKAAMKTNVARRKIDLVEYKEFLESIKQ